jgi:hypothetical protein
MYNLWVPSIYSRYLAQIRDSQSTSGATSGFVASVVPGKAPKSIPAFGQSGNRNDLSWSVAYPLDAFFLLRYYGDLASATEHWPSLMLYMDGQLRVASGPSYDNSTSRGLPDFYFWGGKFLRTLRSMQPTASDLHVSNLRPFPSQTGVLSSHGSRPHLAPALKLQPQTS